MRLTHETKRVLHVMLEAPTEKTYGFKLSEAAGLTPGSVYAILKRLEDAEWVTSRSEDLDEREGQSGRPRRYYRLTGEGERAAHAALDDQRAAFLALTPGWAR